jgi:hypothetical protein
LVSASFITFDESGVSVNARSMIDGYVPSLGGNQVSQHNPTETSSQPSISPRLDRMYLAHISGGDKGACTSHGLARVGQVERITINCEKLL